MSCRCLLLPILTACLALISGAGCQQNRTAEFEQQNADQSATTEQVCRMTAVLMNVPPKSVKPNTTLGELGADELDFVELVMELEEHFNVTIPDESSDQLLGSDGEAGLNQVTMSKLATVVDRQRVGAK